MPGRLLDALTRPWIGWGLASRRARLAFLLLLVAVLAYAVWRGATGGNDFKNPYRTARVFWQTGALDIAGEPRYPPTIRVLWAPLAALPMGAAAGLWAVLSIGALLGLPGLLERLSGTPPRRQALAWLAVLTFAFDALALGQSEPVSLWLVTRGLVWARGGRGVAGAGLIGLAAMVKVLPAAFWAVLPARGRAGAAAGGIALTAVAGFALLAGGAGGHRAWTSVAEWQRGVARAEQPWHLVERRNSLRENNESLPIVLARTFGDLDPALSRSAVPVLRLPLGTIWAAWGAVLLLMALAWLWAAWRARRAAPGRAWLGLFALTAGLVLAVSPIAWPHYFLWLLPAAVFCAHRPRLLVAVAALGQLGMMVPHLRGLGVHPWLALALFGVVAVELIRGAGARAAGEPPVTRPAGGGRLGTVA
jgi:alpha-1,2-mannosyltransferase